MSAYSEDGLAYSKDGLESKLEDTPLFVHGEGSCEGTLGSRGSRSKRVAQLPFCT